MPRRGVDHAAGLATAARAGTATIVASVGSLTCGEFSDPHRPPAPVRHLLDAPANNSTVAVPFTVRGWAINRSAAADRIDAVHVRVPANGGAPIFLGAATTAVRVTSARFTAPSSPLRIHVERRRAAAGTYTVTVRSQRDHCTFDAARTTITVTAPSATALYVIAGATGRHSAFEVVGWAADLGAPSGTGVDAIQFYVQPNGTPAPGTFVGAGTYGIARGDVGAILGPQFTNVGFHFTITGMGPGSGVINAYAHSTVTGGFSIVKTVPFSVNANQLMSIDLPSPESTVTGPDITIAGWAIDRSTASGSGVDAWHVYAYPNPGSGQAPVFVGIAAVGFARSDVAAQ